MKQREFKKIAKELLPHFPRFVTDRKLIFMSPIEDLLCGVSFGSSVDPGIFYVSKFFLPLYVPNEGIHETFGERLRINGDSGWRDDDPNLMQNLIQIIHLDAMPFLNNVSTLNGATSYLNTRVEITRPRTNSHTLEALAYTLIKTGDYSSALKSIAELKQMLEGNTVPWVIAQFNRVQLIKEKLLRNSGDALQQLEIWKAETIRNLKLEKFC
jgi:hypothetical protein